MQNRVSLGLRASPKAVWYTIAKSDSTSDQGQVLKVQSIYVPLSLALPDRLKYLRLIVIDLIEAHGVSYACIRVSETVARKQNTERVYIEGVLQELIASAPLQAYFTGQISSISARLNIDRSDFKKIIANKSSAASIVIDAKFKKAEERESILSALSALSL